MQAGSEHTGFRRLRQFHEDPKIISAWMRLTGPVLGWMTPSRRRNILALGAAGIALKHAFRGSQKITSWSQSAPDLASSCTAVAIIFCFLYLCYRLAIKFESLPSFVRKYPQLSLHSVYWLLLVILWNTAPDSGVWRIILGIITVKLSYFLWRLGYMFLAAKRKKIAGTGFKDHLMYLWPLYGGSHTPYGKGFEYLARHEAKDEESLARSQLAGIKLLLLALLWDMTKHLLEGLVFGSENLAHRTLGGLSLNVPHLRTLVGMGSAAPVALSWAAVYFELINEVLGHAIGGHKIIGIARLFGFHVFRNTYKPLLSKSVVEFWNRFYYYFKEIMVEFFFYPTFAKWFRRQPRLRLFAAVFMAAFVGNTYYHAMRKMEYFAYNGVFDPGYAFYNRLFYCLLLSIGIYISMLREQRKSRLSRPGSFFQRGLAIFGVWTFFSMINIWNQGAPAPLGVLITFFFHLFGVA